MKFVNLFLIVFIVGIAVGHAKSLRVYKHIDKEGIIHYSSKKPRNQHYKIINVKCPECGWKNKVNWQTTPLVTGKFEKEINSAAKKFTVAPSLIKAIIHAESSFKPDAQSSVGAQGLMQLMPATQKIYSVKNPFDPKQNIHAGTALMKHLLKTYNNNLSVALAAYNSGEGAVKKYNNTVPPFEETENYVKRVKILQKRYRK